MQWSLFLLILMGPCSFFTCQLYKYQFIKENKTWHEARTYCREKYTDLATVSNMTDMERLKNQEAAWIGLYNNANDSRTWHWSLPGVESKVDEKMWKNDEPSNGAENCVLMDNYKLKDVTCSQEHRFICYDETKKSNKTYHLINSTKTWLQAQNYCREHHTDLVSGHNQLNDKEFKNENKPGNILWIGLFRDTWRWSDGSSFSFRNWDLELFKDESNKACAMTVLNGFSSDACNKKKPFFCYEDKVILIRENKTWVKALDYCRENHRDLVSITNLDEQRWVQEKAKKAETSHVWLGLRYTCTLDFWFWVSDEVINYKNWASDGRKYSCDVSGAMDRGGEHQWFSKIDQREFNFICASK